MVEVELPIRANLNADVVVKERSNIMKTKALKLRRYEEAQMINISIFSTGDVISTQQEVLIEKFTKNGMTKQEALKKSQEIVEEFFRACEWCSKNNKPPFRIHITEFTSDPDAMRNKIRFTINKLEYKDGKYHKKISTKNYGDTTFVLERLETEKYISENASIVATID